jgi:hypothetical protein
MSDTEEIIVTAVVKDLESAISNTIETPLDNIIQQVETKTKSLISEGQIVVDETTTLIEETIQSVDDIATTISDEATRITDAITRLSITIEQKTEKAFTLITRIKKFIKLILSCTHTQDKSINIPVKVATDELDVSVTPAKIA